MVKLYSEYFERTYYARQISWANWFSWVTIASILILPLIYAVATRNFWQPPTVYYGRPNVKFTNEVFVQAEVGDSILSYSNVQPVQALIRHPIDAPIFKSAEFNPDNDRVYRNFQFKFSFRSGASDVSSIAMLLHFTYYADGAPNVHFKAAMPVFISSPSGASISKAILSGQMRIEQRSALQVGDGLADTLYNHNFTEELIKYSPNNIFERFTSRNTTIKYDHTSIVQSFGDPTTTEVEMDVLIPGYESILYRPGFVESLKVAWVQYWALLIPLYVLLYLCLLGNDIEAEVFPTVSVNDLPKDPTKAYLYS